MAGAVFAIAARSVTSASTANTFESASAASTGAGSGYHAALPACTVPNRYTRLVIDTTSQRKSLPDCAVAARGAARAAAANRNRGRNRLIMGTILFFGVR